MTSPLVPPDIVKPFEGGLESHAHRLAKELMVKWLRDVAASVGHDNYAKFCGLSWRVNRGGPHWGIHAEVPVLQGATGINPVWDEVLEDPHDPDEWICCPPSYRDLANRGSYPQCVIDIGIQHKGCVIYAIEIEHKHPCGSEKIAFLRQHILCDILIVPAYWVLGQVSVPVEMPDEFYAR
jgi:hypothetical protein